MNKTIKIVILLLLILSLPAFIFAETITLKSGKKIEGKILDKTDNYIKVYSNGAFFYYRTNYIESIDGSKPVVSLPQEKVSCADAKSYLKKGFGYAAERKFKEAEEEFKQGLMSNVSDHNLEEALKMIDDLKNGTVNEEYALRLFKGSNYLIDTQYAQAITEFKEALKVNPNNPDLYYYLGVAYYSSGEAQEALNYLEKAKELNTDDPEIYYYLGVSYYSIGKYEEATSYLEKELALFPDDAESHSLIGISNYLLGRDEVAKDNLSRAIELFKKQGDYLRAMDIENLLNRLSLDNFSS